MDAIEKPIIWIDLEMTGLNVASDTILEIAVAITDCWLHEIKQVAILSSITPEPYYASAKITNLVIHATDEVLNNMSNWCRATFTASGNQLRTFYENVKCLKVLSLCKP
jgi:oligoribonuclease